MPKHIVINVGHSSLIIEPEPKWRIPTACFYVAFYADPVSVLRYGANSLHFAEHVLYNLTTKNLIRANATTYNGGEMCAFGVALEADVPSKMDTFYTGLIKMARCEADPKIFSVEQRRVTCETIDVRGASDRLFGRMFEFNPDMVHSEFPEAYVWNILLKECMLGRVVVVAHCHIESVVIEEFRRLASDFEEAWKKRKDCLPTVLSLPMYYAPPFSFLSGFIEPYVAIPFTDNFDPIDRMLASSNLFGFVYYRQRNATKPYISVPDNTDQYYFVPALSSYPGPIKAKWVDEMKWTSAFEIYRKRKDELTKKIKQLIK